MSKTVLYLVEKYEGDSVTAAINAFKELGFEVTLHSRYELRDGNIPLHNFDIVCTEGPHSWQSGTTGMLDLSEALQAIPESRRPYVIWLVFENIANLNQPLWLLKLKAHLRCSVDRLLRPWATNKLAEKLYGINHRARILGEILIINKHQTIDYIGTNNMLRNKKLALMGVESHFVPIAYDSNYGKDLSMERDIDVLFLGRISKRRRPWIEELQNNFSKEGINFHIETGQNGYLWGEERSKLLNRCKIILNVLREPTDATGERLILAMSNKTLLISEKSVDPSPYTPGKHFVESDLAGMESKVKYYLQNEQEREKIAHAAYEFVTKELTAKKQFEQILKNIDKFKGVKA